MRLGESRETRESIRESTERARTGDLVREHTEHIRERANGTI